MADTTPRCGIRGCPQPAKPDAFIVINRRRYSDGSTDTARLPICAAHDRPLRDLEPGKVGLEKL